jgi:hypothetical protein
MRKLLFFLHFVLLICVSYSYANLNSEPFISAIGCDFLSLSQNITSDRLFAVILYNNTEIYVDINNDEIRDFSYFGNEGDLINLILPNKEYPKAGSKIYSTKPIWLKQILYFYDKIDFLGTHSTYEYQTTITPLKNLKKEYVLQHDEFFILSEKDTQIIIGEKKEDISAHVPKLIYINSPQKIVSKHPIYAYSKYGPAQLSSYEYYLDLDVAKISVLENNTEIFFDYDLDGYYDYNRTYESGQHIEKFIKHGIKLKSINEFGLSSKMSSKNNNNIRFYPVYPKSQLSNEYFTYKTPGDRRKVFNYITGISSSNELHKTNENMTLSKNIFIIYEEDGLQQMVFENPFMIKEYSENVLFEYFFSESNQNPSADIVFTQFIREKNIFSNSNFTLILRLFNTYKNSNISNVSLIISLSQSFLFNESFVNAKIKDLINDSILEEISDISFKSQNEVSILLQKLTSQSYIEIEILQKTVKSHGVYALNNVGLSYDADIWS